MRSVVYYCEWVASNLWVVFCEVMDNLPCCDGNQLCAIFFNPARQDNLLLWSDEFETVNGRKILLLMGAMCPIGLLKEFVCPNVPDLDSLCLMHTACGEKVVSGVDVNGFTADQRSIDNTAMSAALSNIPDNDVPVPTTRVQHARMRMIKLYAEDLIGVPLCINIVTELDSLACLLIIDLD